MVKHSKKGIPRRRGRKREGGGSSGGQSKSSHKNTKTLLVQLNETAPTWYTVAADHPERNATLRTHPPPPAADPSTNNRNHTVQKQQQQQQVIERYRAQADELYRQEVQLFNARNNDKDANWMHATMSKGTLKDRIAAMSVTVSTDPFHKFYALDGLLQMTGSLTSSQAPNSRVAQLAGDALVDLFVSALLPKKRKLVTLAQRPLHLYEKQQQQLPLPPHDNKDAPASPQPQKTLSPRILLLWRFEEMVREKYHLFITKYFGYMLREGNDLQKIPTLRVAADLLKAVPEGEAQVLTLIINKLGDPNKKVAAAAGHQLRSVLQVHPAMQMVIAREVQQLAHRPHLSERALYNCITFLNQLALRPETAAQPVEQRLPSSLVQTYFRLFEVAVRVDDSRAKKKKKKKVDPNSATTTTTEEAVAMKGRLLSALLTGVNRARPYLLKALGELEEHVNSLYHVVHKSQPSACTQALLLLFHATVGTVLETNHSSSRASSSSSSSSSKLTDVERAHQRRFYIALYSKLGQTAMIGSGKHLTMFFNLLYKSIKYDTDKNRVLAFAKRLLSTALHCTSAVISASLFLLNEIAKFHPEVLECQTLPMEGKDAKRVYDMREQDPSKAIKSPSSGEESGQSDTRLAPSWEMCLAMQHYHPTVQAFTKDFGQISYNGDPLVDFTLGPFLDKFAYRNPKSTEKVAGRFSRGNSVAERRSGNERRIEDQFSLPFNDPTFIQSQNIDAADQFFHQFFVERARRDELQGVQRKKKNNEESDEEEETENDALDAAEGQISDFGKYEANWESDEEEEAFVDSLAQQIIEDSMDANELGPDELDDEDPDMDGWDDMYDEDDENEEDDQDQNTKEPFGDSDSDNVGGLESSDDEDHMGETSPPRSANINMQGDDDDFMDDSDSDDDSDSHESLQGEAPWEEDIEGDSAAEDFEHDDDESSSASPDPQLDDEEEEDAMFWLQDDENSDEELSTEKNGNKKETLPTFASLEEYEEMINKSWRRVAASEASEKEVIAGERSDRKGKKRRLKK